MRILTLIALLLLVIVTAACNEPGCTNQEVPMYWIDGSTSSMTITICV